MRRYDMAEDRDFESGCCWATEHKLELERRQSQGWRYPAVAKCYRGLGEDLRRTHKLRLKQEAEHNNFEQYT